MHTKWIPIKRYKNPERLDDKMRLDQLYYLVELAKTGSITLTAERNYISQPCITDAIKKMEQELGVTILERSYRGVSFTEAGERVLKTSEQILALYDTLKSELDLLKDNKPDQLFGNLLIYVTPGISKTVLPVALNAFSKHYPNVKTIVKEGDIFNVLEGVRDSHADLAILTILENLLMTNNVSQFISDDMYFEKLFYDNLSILVSRSSDLASRKSIGMKEILRYPLVFYSSQVADWWMEIFKNYGNPNPSIYLKSNSTEVFMNAIKEDRAIGFGADLFSKYFLRDNEEVVPIPIKEDLKWVFGWLKPKHSQLSTAAQEFIKVLKSVC